MPTTKTKTPKISFKDFMKILSTLKSSACCVNENHSFYIYRADTHQVLARGLDGYEAAKTAANHLRHSLGLKWDQVGFKKETNPTGTNSTSGGVIAGPGALEQGMTGAAGTTHQKEVTFGGTTALMGLITTLIEETSGP